MVAWPSCTMRGLHWMERQDSAPATQMELAGSLELIRSTY